MQLTKNLLMALLIMLVGCSAVSPADPPNPKYKLILVISVDQMRFDYLTRFADLYKGGFRQLLDRGAVFTNANYRHANTETGPGHSVILSGRHASHSGINLNRWYDHYLKKWFNVVDDPVVTVVGGVGRSASPVNFLGFTLGDVVKFNFPESRMVGVALKDRAAILMSGHRADAAFWFESEGGRFVTSSYYMKTAPKWLDDWNARRLPDYYSGKSWNRLINDPSLYEKYAGPDNIPSEADGKDTVFPHVFRSRAGETRFYDELHRSPFADELILAMATEILSAYNLGKRSSPDILAVGFSATDYIGHNFGCDSQEIMDQMLRLDQTLQKLFQVVDSRVKLSQTLIVLTADHGSMPLVEVLKAKGIDAQRVHPNAVILPVQKALQAKYPGAEGLIAFAEPPDFYLNEDAIKKNGLRRDDVESTIAAAMMQTGVIAAVYTQTQMINDAGLADPYWSFLKNSFYQPRSPHLIGRVKKYVYLSAYKGGTGHGTPYEYDTHVPIVFMGPGIKGGTYAGPCGPEDIAPTLAQLLGLDFPRESDSRLLTEMIEQGGK
jgi:predicted AlkP superfamily pyrophosphatase or phosphodiesterase